jgi:hypothetical protein
VLLLLLAWLLLLLRWLSGGLLGGRLGLTLGRVRSKGDRLRLLLVLSLLLVGPLIAAATSKRRIGELLHKSLTVQKRHSVLEGFMEEVARPQEGVSLQHVPLLLWEPRCGQKSLTAMQKRIRSRSELPVKAVGVVEGCLPQQLHGPHEILPLLAGDLGNNAL